MTRILQTGEAVQQTGVTLTTFIPIRIKRHGGRKVVVPAAGNLRPEHDAPILTALARAFHWQRLLDEGRVTSGSEIARREGLHPSTVNELLRLTLLSPAVVRAILAGHQPRTLSLIVPGRIFLPVAGTIWLPKGSYKTSFPQTAFQGLEA